MKCFYFITIFVLVNSFTVCGQALTGDKTIGAGTGKNYNSIAAAIADLNSNGVGTGGVTFLVDAGHVEQLRLDEGKIIVSGTIENPIIFRKTGIGNNPILNPVYIATDDSATITILGGDYITFDGIDIIDDASVGNYNCAYGYAILSNLEGACNNLIKNCNISLSLSAPEYSAAIKIAGSYQNNDNTINNVQIVKAKSGIKIFCQDYTNYNSNINISNCKIGNESEYNIEKYGIFIYRGKNINILNNLISGIYGSDICGILINSVITSSTHTIANNIIFNLKSNNIDKYVYGINLTSANSPTIQYMIYNNMISSLSIDYSPSYLATLTIQGIRDYNSQCQMNIFHNSISIDVNNPTSAACFYTKSNSISLYNNMFIIKSTFDGKCYTIYKSTAGVINVSDYNNLFAPEINNYIGYFSTDRKSLINWQSASSEDIHSISQQVYFKSTTDLHLDRTSIGNFDLAGMNLSSLGLPGYDKDIDGESRNISNPYMGADEDPTHPVPVEMATFEASKCANFISLYWNTKTELNCIQFDIERRCEDESCWTYIATVPGHGNSYNFNEYSFIDNYRIGNKTQYRLKQIDNDGEYKYYYSNILDAELINNYELYGNYPNPFNPSTTISYNLQNEGEVIIKIYSISGELIQTNKEGMKSKGYNETKIDLNNYPSGNYLYQLEVFGINNLKIFDALKKMILVK